MFVFLFRFLSNFLCSLHRFTRYEYQLEVYNDVGSSPGDVVSAVTMAGIPRCSPSLSAQAVNHTAVHVNWTQPCKFTQNFTVDLRVCV